IFGERLGRLILGVWGLVPFALGLLVPAKNEERRALNQVQGNASRWFIQFCLLGAFLYVSIVATANVRHDYYQAITVPLICLSLAQGSLILWRAKGWNVWVSRGILIVSIGVMLIVSSLQVREYYKINHPEIIEAGKAAD